MYRMLCYIVRHFTFYALILYCFNSGLSVFNKELIDRVRVCCVHMLSKTLRMKIKRLSLEALRDLNFVV